MDKSVEIRDFYADRSNEPSVTQLIESHVARKPDSIALIFGQKRLTYRELNCRANQLARYLLTLGVGPDTLVGICSDRSEEMFVGILGILKAGAAYVPFDSAYPRERLAFMISDSRPAFVLTQTHLAEEIPGNDSSVVFLDSLDCAPQSGEIENPGVRRHSNDLAYVIYTSGSTGIPKGVMISHGNLAHYVRSMQVATGVDQADVYLHTASISFSSSVRQLMLPLSVGATVAIASRDEIRDPIVLFRMIKRIGITLVDLVPSYWRSCVYSLKSLAPAARVDLLQNDLRLILSASEPLLSDIPRSWRFELGHQADIVNMFGQTETAGIVATCPITPNTDDNNPKVPVGKSIKDVKVYLLDDQLNPVEFGGTGELCIGGPTVGRGYLNRPELTAERFVPDPFLTSPNSRMYRTGDLARYLPSGDIEHLGRIDSQVKIRGYRIELGEVEAVITAYPVIKECVVIARDDQLGDRSLVAYLVPEKNQPVLLDELRLYVKSKLPEYMVPALFLELDELPFTPSGKVDRKALPTLRPVEPSRVLVPPRNDTEVKLAEIWEKILGIESIGVDDNFFDLGGHSLQAVRMFAEVESAFGKGIPLGTLFQAGTIEKLAEILRQDGWSSPESSLVSIQPNGNRPPFFCIHAKGGNVLFYRELASNLGQDQPFYGIQARRVGGRQVGHDTVEEMAEFYISEIQSLQPQGPYFLGGSSFGGLAAFEIARRLRARGQKIALLALLDTAGPNYPRLLPGTTKLRIKIYHLARRIQLHKDSLRVLKAGERFGYILDKIAKVKKKYYRQVNNRYRKAGRKLYSAIEQPIPENFFQLEDKIHRAGQKYKPQVSSVKATLFRAAIQPLGIYPDPTLGWDGLAAEGLEIHEVPGHHGSMVVEPYVRTLAKELNRCIEAAISDIAAQKEMSGSQVSQLASDPDSSLGLPSRTMEVMIPERSGVLEI